MFKINTHVVRSSIYLYVSKIFKKKKKKCEWVSEWSKVNNLLNFNSSNNNNNRNAFLTSKKKIERDKENPKKRNNETKLNSHKL